MQNRQSGLYLQPNNDFKKEGEGYRQYIEIDATAQKWTLEYAEDGRYYIHNSISHLYMTSTDAGVTQQALNNSLQQRWLLLYAEEGSYIIMNADTKFVPASSSTDSIQQENILFEAVTGEQTQIWKIDISE